MDQNYKKFTAHLLCFNLYCTIFYFSEDKSMPRILLTKNFEAQPSIILIKQISCFRFQGYTPQPFLATPYHLQSHPSSPPPPPHFPSRTLGSPDQDPSDILLFFSSSYHTFPLPDHWHLLPIEIPCSIRESGVVRQTRHSIPEHLREALQTCTWAVESLTRYEGGDI